MFCDYLLNLKKNSYKKYLFRKQWLPKKFKLSSDFFILKHLFNNLVLIGTNEYIMIELQEIEKN